MTIHGESEHLWSSVVQIHRSKHENLLQKPLHLVASPERRLCPAEGATLRRARDPLLHGRTDVPYACEEAKQRNANIIQSTK